MDRQIARLLLVVVLSLAAVTHFLPASAPRLALIAKDALTRIVLSLARRSPDGTGATTGADQAGAKAVIIMDDGWLSQYTCGYAKLQEHGLKACIAVIPALVGERGYMDYRQLAVLYLAGWDLLNHTYTHPNLTTLAESEQRKELVKARSWLNKRGFSRGSDVVIYPQGQATSDLQILARTENFRAARDLYSLWDLQSNSTYSAVDICNLISDSTFPAVKDSIDNCIAQKSTLILMLHKLEPVTIDTQMQLDPGLFSKVVDYLAENSTGIQVVTLTEFIASQQPRGRIKEKQHPPPEPGCREEA